MPDPIELTPDSLKTAAQKGTQELRNLLENVQGEDVRKAKVDRARAALKFLQQEQQQKFSDPERRAIVEVSRLVIQDALENVTQELQKAAGAKIKELEKQQQEFHEAKVEALQLEANLASLAGRAGIEWRELKLDLRHASTEEKAYLAGVGAISAGVVLWLWNKIWGSKEKPGAVRRLGGLIAAAAAGIAGVLMLRNRGPKGKGGDSWFKKAVEKAPAPVQVAVGVPVGIGAQAAERGGAVAEAVSHIPAALYELLAKGDIEGAANQGWMFVKEGTGWVVTNLKETYEVPAKFVGSLSDEKLSTYDCAVIYGEAGVAYLLGRATLKSLLTGKVSLPLSARSLGMAGLRAAAWPLAVARDGANLGIMTFTHDGKIIAHTTYERWCLRGVRQDWYYRGLAKSGTEKGLREAMQYFQKQNRVVGAFERQLEGPLRGSVSTEGLASVRNANQRLAQELARGGAKLKAELQAAGRPIPPWVDELGGAVHLSDDKVIVETVDRAGAKLFGAADDAADSVARDVERVLAREGASVDDVLRAGGSVGDALGAGSLDDVCRALNGMDDAAATKHVADLLRADYNAQRLVDAGVDLRRVVRALGEFGDDLRGFHIKSLLDGKKCTLKQLVEAGAQVADIIRVPGASLDELMEAVMHIDDVAVRQARIAELLASGGDTIPSRLLSAGVQADDLLRAGARPALVVDAVLGMEDDAMRMAAMREVLATEHADELVGAISRSGKPQLVRDVQAVVEGATDLSDDVARSVRSLSVETGETAGRAAARTGSVLPEGARVAAGAEGLTHAAPAVVASDAAESSVRLYRPSVAEEAQRALRESMGATDFEALMRHKPCRVLLEGEHADEAARFIAVGMEEGRGLAGAKNVARYLLAIGDDAPAALRAPEVVRMVSSGSHGNAAAIGRFLANGARAGGEVTGGGCVKAIEQMTRWQKAGTGMRSLYFVGAAAEVGFLGYEIYNATQEYASETKQLDALKGELTRIGLKPSSGNPNVYEGFGVEVSLETLDPTNFEASLTRAGIAAGSLATTILAPSFVLGPGGLLVAGVVITAVIAVDTIWSAVEQRRHLEFLSSAPAWLLAMLGTESTIGQTAYDTVREYNGVIMSDIVPTTFTEGALAINPLTAGLSPFLRENREGRKEQARENVMLGHMYRRFAQYYDTYLPELPNTQDGPRSLFDPQSEFMKPGGDFERIVRPYLILRLHAETKGEGVAFATTQHLDLSEREGGFASWLAGAGFPAVSKYEFDDALEEAMMLEVWHRREKLHWARIDHIAKKVEEEKQRLVGIKEMSAESREARITLYREALEEAYEDEIQYDPAGRYIFNVHPKNIPRRSDGLTWAEAVVQERTKWASRVQSGLSAGEAAHGFSLPWVKNGEAMDVAEFAREHVRPKQLESVRLRVEKNSPPKGEPFSFQELEAMGQPADLNEKWDAEQFRQRFTAAIAPLERVSNVFTRQMKTDAQLKEAVQTNADAMDFYLQFTEHESYYRDYLSHWRGVSVSLPLRVSREFVSLLRDWRRKGCPKLVPTEEEFRQIQSYARNRNLSVPAEGQLPLVRRSGGMFGTGAERQGSGPVLRLPGMDLPGYDPGREGVLLCSYGGYAYLRKRPQEEQLFGGDAFLLLDPRERILRSLRIGTPAGSSPYGDRLRMFSPLPSRTRDEHDRSLHQLYSQMNGKYLDATGNAVPILALQGRDDLVALTPQEAGMLFQRLNPGFNPDMPFVLPRRGEAPVPSALIPKYLPLQQYLLQSRLFIIHDPQPQQPSLPLDLSGTSIRLPLPSAN
ncbi:hypothetical protein A2598_06385 [Candidatus Peribacteria bacterium RIFOXYD1_FULL_54_13]|nr:MAG: hypothetical protein A2598_06385 [Candidatus Peribacteria bacterium RIFOXYD1_FULL_54_13]